VKNLAKLALFFSLSFAIIFLAATGIRFLSLRVEWAQNLPPKPETALTIVIAAAHWALSLAMYSSILLGLSYAARRRYFAPMAVLCVMTLSLFFNFIVSSALYNWKSVPPAEITARQMGGDGLILSNSLNRNETSVILLKGTADPLGPRVTAIPDRPLVFHESMANAAAVNLPPIPFGDDTPWFYKSLIIDLRLSEEHIQQRFNEGLVHYFIYAGALIFLLSSLGFAIKFSVWPLANLFLGVLAFRGILAIETFFNSPEMQDIFDSFFRNMMPSSFAVPLIFFAFGLLINLYEVLVYVAKRRDDHEF
jgi:hypothetical protein